MPLPLHVLSFRCRSMYLCISIIDFSIFPSLSLNSAENGITTVADSFDTDTHITPAASSAQTPSASSAATAAKAAIRILYDLLKPAPPISSCARSTLPQHVA